MLARKQHNSQFCSQIRDKSEVFDDHYAKGVKFFDDLTKQISFMEDERAVLEYPQHL